MENKKNIENCSITFDEIMQIIDKVSDSKLDEFYFCNEAVEFKMKKNQQTLAAAEPEKLSAAASPASLDKSEEGLEDTGSFYVVKSPIVGTFYASKEEGGEPLVKVGSKVKKDSIVAIIEAMKLMNEITAGADGEIAEILVDNGELVEYGQEIMKIRL